MLQNLDISKTHAETKVVKNTVDSKIFTRVLFSEYAMFRENKILTKWRNHSVVC